MAQSGYTPIQLYYSSTTTNTPLAGNLTAGELAINTADGKLFYKDSGGTVQIIATKEGASGTVSSVALSGGTTGLTVSGSPITTSGTITLAGTLAIANGGSGQTTAQTAMNAFAGAVTSGSYLRGNGTNVVMSTIQAADVPTLNQNTTGSAATLTTGRTIAITGDLSYTSPSFNGSANVTAAGTLATVNANVGSFTNASITVNGKGLITAASSGTAPVTSVTGTSPVASSGGTTPAISLSSGYGDTQNPYASKTANYVLAAPNGSAGVPTFRAIVAADIPTLNQNTTGTASNVTGTVDIANGGSGQTTAQAAMNAFAGAVTSGSYLRGDGTNVVMSTIQVADVPTLNQNTTGSAATLTTARTFRTNLASTATASFNGSANVTPGVTGTLPVANGGTGATTLAGANIAVTNAAQSFSAAQRGTISALTDGVTITPDFALGNNYSVTLGGNRTLANPSNLVAGQSGSIFISQDGTGGRTLAWGSYWDFANGTAPTLTTTASAVDRVDYVVRSSTSIQAVWTGNYS